MPRAPKVFRKLAVTGVTALVGIVVWGSVSPAAAVPVFARKYQTSCQTCHVAFPKLNPHGEAFRLNGYRMPEEEKGDEHMVKEEPLSLGSEAYERIWPDAVYPTTIPAHVPIALNVKMADVYASSLEDGDRELIHNDFQFPQEANLFAAGTMGKTFSFISEVTYAETADGGSEVEIERAQLHVNSPFGPPHVVNFKIGKFAPDLDDGFHEMWLMTNNGVDAVFSFSPIGLSGGSELAEDGPGISLPGNVKGVEMYGVASHRLFYTVGLTNGIGPGPNDTTDANSGKDVYARVDYKFGGMALDGDTTGVTLPAENWRERSLRIGLLGYRGDGGKILFPVTDEEGTAFTLEDDRFDRVGVFASLYVGDLNLFGVAMRGNDHLRLRDEESGELVSQRSRSYDSWFLQGDYVIKPPFQVSLRYEQLRPADPAASKLELLNANFTYLMRANVKTMLEYRRDLNEGKNYELDAVLRFAL